jgi:hypothetical protein
METLTSPAELSVGGMFSGQERTISRYGALVLALAVLMIAVFYAATIRRGNFWPDDYALYVHHSENLANGRAYADTGYIYNPDVADYSPRAYPPVFPLLLAPVYRVYGLNLQAMKLEVVGFFVLMLISVAAYWRRDLEWRWLVALVMILGLSPIFWAFKDSVVADIPFLFFFYFTALLVRDAPREGRNWWQWAITVGLFLYLCIGTRTVGISVPAGMVLYECLMHRRITRFALLALLVCGAVFLLQHAFLGFGEGSYADQLHPSLTTITSNLKEYSQDFATLWTKSLGRVFSLALFGLTTLLAGIGLRRHWDAGLSVLEAFLFPYVLIVIVWPSTQGLRFLFPLIPFYIYLVMLGLEELKRFWPLFWRRSALVSVMSLIALSYVVAFQHAAYGLIRQTDGDPAFNDLCGFIRNNTSAGDVLVFRRSRALSLFTSRPGTVYDLQHEDRLATEFTKVGAKYVITSSLFEEDRHILIPFVRAHSAAFQEVYGNFDFKMYRILQPIPQARLH